MYRLELPTPQGRSFWTGSGFSDWLYEAQIYRSAGAAKNARYQLVTTLRRPNVSDWATVRQNLTVVEHRTSEDPCSSTIPTRIPVPTAAATGGQPSDPFGTLENLSNLAMRETPDNGSAALNVPDPVSDGSPLLKTVLGGTTQPTHSEVMEEVGWLTSCPTKDTYFQHKLKRADIQTLEKALEIATASPWGNQTRIRVLNQQWRKLKRIEEQTLANPPERKILELKVERAQLLKEGILPGWIEPYTVTRQNKSPVGARKDGKPRKLKPSERVYTYHHHVWWESGSERRKHLSNRQLEITQAAIERRRRVEQIEAELKKWERPDVT